MPRSSAVDRFWSKVDATGICWEWTAAKNPRGYGIFSHDFRSRLAHRVAWELLVGPIPSGMVIDHVCRNPGCVNPDHLDVVTQSENLRRSPLMGRYKDRTHCPYGHVLDGRKRTGTRYCLTCNNQRNRAWRAKQHVA